MLAPSGRHLVAQGCLPLGLAATGAAVELAVRTPEALRTLLARLASGLILGTLCEQVFPETVARSLESPGARLGTGAGLVLGTFTKVWLDRWREEARAPSPALVHEDRLFRADVSAVMVGFTAAAVLFESRRTAPQAAYVAALGLGVKALVEMLGGEDADDPGRRRRPAPKPVVASRALSHLCGLSVSFAVGMALLPVLGRSARPVYALVMAWVAVSYLAMALDSVELTGRKDGLAARDWAGTLVLLVGVGLVVAARWVSSDVADLRRLAASGKGG